MSPVRWDVATGENLARTRALLRSCSESSTVPNDPVDRRQGCDGAGPLDDAGAGQWAFGCKGGLKASPAAANALAFVGDLKDAPRERQRIARAPKRARAVEAAPPAVESHSERLRRLARQLNDLNTEYHAAILAAMSEGHGASATARDAGMTRQGVYAVVKRAA